MYFLRIEMGICWSEPPPPPVQQAPVAIQPCKQCGAWSKLNICERCLQRNANAYLQPQPSAPPYQPQPQYQYGYTYAQQPQQQQMYYYQPPVQTILQPPPQQRQMGTATAIGAGFLAGAIMEDILDPTE